jgi:hypothetical protein
MKKTILHFIFIVLVSFSASSCCIYQDIQYSIENWEDDEMRFPYYTEEEIYDTIYYDKIYDLFYYDTVYYDIEKLIQLGIIYDYDNDL